MVALGQVRIVFFFNDTATTEIYTLSLHDALPIYVAEAIDFLEYYRRQMRRLAEPIRLGTLPGELNRSEEHSLNSSHLVISYAVFCLKKKKLTFLITRRVPKGRPGVHTDKLPSELN